MKVYVFQQVVCSGWQLHVLHVIKYSIFIECTQVGCNLAMHGRHFFPLTQEHVIFILFPKHR